MNDCGYKNELLASIPIVKGMDLDIQLVEVRKIVLSAPLNKNINYEGTAFGGSINTLAIFSCYLLTHHILKSNTVSFKSLVIQNSEINYLEPVSSNFLATAEVDQYSLDRFVSTMARRRVARLSVQSKITVDEKTKCLFNGRFVAS